MRSDGTRVSAITLDDDVRSVADARAWVRDFLDGGGAASPCIEQAVLIVSELTSNAIRHGSGEVICELAPDLPEVARFLDFGEAFGAVGGLWAAWWLGGRDR